MFILDTDTVSQLRDPRRWSVEFRNWEKQSDARENYISSITEFEIQDGINRVLPNNPAFAKALQGWLDEAVIFQFQDRIIPITSEICRVAANLAMLPTRDFPDLLIGATALTHDFTVVTRNVKHFEDTGVRIVNPWG